MLFDFTPRPEDTAASPAEDGNGTLQNDHARTSDGAHPTGDAGDAGPLFRRPLLTSTIPASKPFDGVQITSMSERLCLIPGFFFISQVQQQLPVGLRLEAIIKQRQ
jgi:hypothetical protein